MTKSSSKIKPWFVYILLCNDGTLYTGITPNVQKRFELHQESKGAKYTRGRGVKEIVYFQKFVNRSEATKREMEIKKLPRAGKILLTNIKES